MGLNLVGRAPDCDFVVSHPTVSTHHCELVLSAEGVRLHDCGSTNGTFVNDQRVTEVWLEAGQAVRFGEVAYRVESTEVTIAIPVVAPEPVPAPVLDEEGMLMCPRHPRSRVLFQCTHCQETMCAGCVHVLRRKGGEALYLCLVCSHKCERIFGEDQLKKRKSLFGMLKETVVMGFFGRPPHDKHD